MRAEKETAVGLKPTEEVQVTIDTPLDCERVSSPFTVEGKVLGAPVPPKGTELQVQCQATPPGGGTPVSDTVTPVTHIDEEGNAFLGWTASLSPDWLDDTCGTVLSASLVATVSSVAAGARAAVLTDTKRISVVAAGQAGGISTC